jgi:hypothetical protein
MVPGTLRLRSFWRFVDIDDVISLPCILLEAVSLALGKALFFNWILDIGSMLSCNHAVFIPVPVESF